MIAAVACVAFGVDRIGLADVCGLLVFVSLDENLACIYYNYYSFAKSSKAIRAKGLRVDVMMMEAPGMWKNCSFYL